SRIVLTTRLFLAELETIDGLPMTGVLRLQLQGFQLVDALALAAKLGLSFDEAQFTDILNSIRSYPLGIRALAGAVTRSRYANGSLKAWMKENPGFDLTTLNFVQSRNHVLAYAMKGLEALPLFTLATIAAFRWPPTFDMIAETSVGPSKPIT